MRVQTYARIVGVVFIIAVIAGGIGEGYVPSLLTVSNDATATANNLSGHDLLYRLGFAAYVVEAITDVALTFLLYVLLRPVHANLAFLAVLFRLMATATFSFAELFYFAPTLILGGDSYLKTFSPEQLHSLALLSLNIYSLGGNLYNFHYGIGSIILGALMFQSGYVPRVLGGLWVLGGAGFLIATTAWIFAPPAPFFFDVPQLLGLLALGLWLMMRGVDVSKWNEHRLAAPVAERPRAAGIVG